jgi:hypothetical protein
LRTGDETVLLSSCNCQRVDGGDSLRTTVESQDCALGENSGL